MKRSHPLTIDIDLASEQAAVLERLVLSNVHSRRRRRHSLIVVVELRGYTRDLGVSGSIWLLLTAFNFDLVSTSVASGRRRRAAN